MRVCKGLLIQPQVSLLSISLLMSTSASAFDSEKTKEEISEPTVHVYAGSIELPTKDEKHPEAKSSAANGVAEDLMRAATSAIVNELTAAREERAEVRR